MPSIFAGDEIGVRYLPGLPDVEGSVWEPTYNRSGARTPVQWDTSANAGFSTAPADRLYLPVDPDPDRPDVAAQRADPDSVLHAVRRLITLRRATRRCEPAGRPRSSRPGTRWPTSAAGPTWSWSTRDGSPGISTWGPASRGAPVRWRSTG